VFRISPQDKKSAITFVPLTIVHFGNDVKKYAAYFSMNLKGWSKSKASSARSSRLAAFQKIFEKFRFGR
jgi:hypothetical protein